MKNDGREGGREGGLGEMGARLNAGVLEDNKEWFQKFSVGRSTVIESHFPMTLLGTRRSHITACCTGCFKKRV